MMGLSPESLLTKIRKALEVATNFIEQFVGRMPQIEKLRFAIDKVPVLSKIILVLILILDKYKNKSYISPVIFKNY